MRISKYDSKFLKSWFRSRNIFIDVHNEDEKCERSLANRPHCDFFRQTGIVSDGEGMQIMLKDWTPAELSLGTG